MTHLDRREFQIVEMQRTLQPFQGQCIPNNLLMGLIMNILYSLTHIIVWNSLIAPPFFLDKMVSEATFMH